MNKQSYFFREWFDDEWEDWRKLKNDDIRRAFILKNGCDPSLKTYCLSLFEDNKCKQHKPQRTQTYQSDNDINKQTLKWTKASTVSGVILGILSIVAAVVIFLLSKYF